MDDQVYKLLNALKNLNSKFEPYSLVNNKFSCQLMVNGKNINNVIAVLW